MQWMVPAVRHVAIKEAMDGASDDSVATNGASLVLLCMKNKSPAPSIARWILLAIYLFFMYIKVGKSFVKWISFFQILAFL